MPDIEKLLTGGDLRSIGQSNAVAELVTNQTEFDALFKLLQHANRVIAMRAADAAEKISLRRPEYLSPHKHTILQLLVTAAHKEIKWHIAQLVPRLPLSDPELEPVWAMLAGWACNTTESNIVRVNALQALFDLARQNPTWQPAMAGIFAKASKENIPSVTARINKLMRQPKLQRPKKAM